MTDLFIGVVSHQGSRYEAHQGAGGPAALIAAVMADRGFACSVEVNTRDGWNAQLLPIDHNTVRESASASLASECRWTRYLCSAGGMSRLACVRRRVELALRKFWLVLNRRHHQPSGTTAVQRLVNIELSHVYLWQRALSTGAAWALILEDDAGCLDVEATATLLMGMITEGQNCAFMNLSESFDGGELGIEGLKTEVLAIGRGSTPVNIYALREPATNTVCAVLYRRPFLEALTDTFEQMPFTPVIPIDFKLNEAILLMRSAGRFRQGPQGLGQCWHVEPAPFVQMSMHEMRGSTP